MDKSLRKAKHIVNNGSEPVQDILQKLEEVLHEECIGLGDGERVYLSNFVWAWRAVIDAENLSATILDELDMGAEYLMKAADTFRRAKAMIAQAQANRPFQPLVEYRVGDELDA